MTSTEGTPMWRPIWIEFPTDENTFDIVDQFMVGGSILIAPKIKPLDLQDDPLRGLG